MINKNDQQKYYYMNRLDEYLYYELFTILFIPLSYLISRISQYHNFLLLIPAFTVILISPLIIIILYRVNDLKLILSYCTLLSVSIIVAVLYLNDKSIWGLLQIELGFIYLYFTIVKSKTSKWIKTYDIVQQRRTEQLAKKFENDLFNRHT